jgi:hypothetical protein
MKWKACAWESKDGALVGTIKRVSEWAWFWEVSNGTESTANLVPDPDEALSQADAAAKRLRNKIYHA